VSFFFTVCVFDIRTELLARRENQGLPLQSAKVTLYDKALNGESDRALEITRLSLSQLLWERFVLVFDDLFRKEG
jgi:hypothetical protein